MEIFIVVLLGAFIGWVTNYIAIKMLFRPRREIDLKIIKIQGLIPKRQKEIATAIAEIVENELISIKDIITNLKDDELDSALEDFVDSALEKKLKESILKSFPKLSIFLTDSMIDRVKNIIKTSLLENKDSFIQFISGYLEEKVDFGEIVRNKVESFSFDKLEKVVFGLTKKEMKHIEIIGAILGGLIGIAQYLVFRFV